MATKNIDGQTNLILKQFCLKLVNKFDVIIIINSLKNQKSVGWDEISLHLIRSCKNYFAALLTKIIKQSLKLEYFQKN